MIFPTKLNLIAILIAAYAAFIYVRKNLYTKLPHYFDADDLDPQFQSILEVFRQNFIDGWEQGGAALTVYYRGQKVVDVWGGYADVQAARKWRRDTITVTFSCLKAAMALCVAMLVDRKLLNYDDLVTKYWPAFGSNGKTNVTVQMLLSHTAGLPYLDQSLSMQTATDHQAMREILENEHPKWTPGEKSGYHGYTFYWLIDQLVRHCDEQKRGIQQFFYDEIASKFGMLTEYSSFPQ